MHYNSFNCKQNILEYYTCKNARVSVELDRTTTSRHFHYIYLPILRIQTPVNRFFICYLFFVVNGNVFFFLVL